MNYQAEIEGINSLKVKSESAIMAILPGLRIDVAE